MICGSVLGGKSLGSKGELIPLDAGTQAAVAFLRRQGEETALVVANLGTEPLTSVMLSSDASVLPPGEYSVDALLGDGPTGQLEIGETGRLEGFSPDPSLEALKAYVFRVSGPVGPR